MASNDRTPRDASETHPHARQDEAAAATDPQPGASTTVPGVPKAPRPPLRHDLTGEFDYGVEGGQTQDHGPDRTDGTGRG